MLKLRHILFLSALVLSSYSSVLAQSYSESALVFSRFRPGGSARVQALGGAQVGLGGDYSSAFLNPAGLGKFNRSEISITPAIGSFNTDATFTGGASNSESVSKFQIPGLAFVFHTPSHREGSAFTSGAFAITFNRTNDFNRSTTYAADKYDGSIIDYFIDQATGNTTSQFDENGFNYNTPVGLAYYNFLFGPANTLDPSYPADEYFTDVQTPPDIRETIETKGASNQWNISYGANFLDKFYIGGGIGLGSLRYKSRKVYGETFSGNEFFDNLSLEENLDIKGTTVNATLGALVRPVDFFQVGVAYTTPTYISVTEVYDASMSTRWKNFDYYGDGKEILNDESAQTDFVTSEYNMTVPSKLAAGVAFISQYGFLTGDVEVTNLSKIKYTSDTRGVDFSQDNDDIRAAYKQTVNYRIGAEGRYSIFRVRAGYGIMANTNNRNFGLNNQITTLTAGFGVRVENFFADFALVRSSGDKLMYYPYTTYDSEGNAYGPAVSIKNTSTVGMITVGVSF